MKSNLAIVIPYYKIDFFAATLDSLVHQTNTNFTVYIGNDASPTNPEELIRNRSELLVLKINEPEAF